MGSARRIFIPENRNSQNVSNWKSADDTKETQRDYQLFDQMYRIWIKKITNYRLAKNVTPMQQWAIIIDIEITLKQIHCTPKKMHNSHIILNKIDVTPKKHKMP